jgi:transposase
MSRFVQDNESQIVKKSYMEIMWLRGTDPAYTPDLSPVEYLLFIIIINNNSKIDGEVQLLTLQL